jgi:hypothetical protein
MEKKYMQKSVHKLSKKAKMGAGGKAGAGGWNGPGREWRALKSNGNGCGMMGEGTGSRGMAKKGPKKRK